MHLINIKLFKVAATQTLALAMAMNKDRYRNSFAGLIWVLSAPIILYSVQAFVFKNFLNIEIEKYYLFLLAGLLPWIFMTTCLDMCTSILVTRGDLIRNTQLYPEFLIAAQVFDNFINFLLSFALMLTIISLFYQTFTLQVAFIIVSITLLFLQTYIIVSTFAIIQVFYRDTKFILPFLTTIGFFLTPIFYPVDFVPEAYRWIITINPMANIIEGFRISLLDFNAFNLMTSFTKSIGFLIITFLLQRIIWKKGSPHVFLEI